MELKNLVRAKYPGFVVLLCFLAAFVSFTTGNVLIEPVPIPPPGDGSVSQGNLGRITPESDETHINQVLGNTGAQILQGDIIADQETREFIKQDPNARNAIRYPHGLWPGNTVPYVIDSSIGSAGVQAIQDAIKDYHRLTCLKFVRRTTQKNYIRFIFGDGCSSSVGRTARGEQKVNLHRHCWYKGIVIHELAHAIGFFHEQSRSDRDSYVRIVYGNIERGRENNFKKFSQREIQHLGEPYDYGSIMHYGAKSFSTNGRSTIVPLKSGASQMGQRKKLSANDIRQINQLYKCPTKPVNPGPDTSSVVYCSFDRGNLCDFVQGTGDDFDWSIKKGPTPSGGTGPSTDLSGTGNYIFIESSNPRVSGDRALLHSPQLTGSYCFRFHLHMMGSDIGSLKVYKVVGSRRSVLFSVSGDRGDQWFRAETSVSDAQQFQIVFEAVRGKGYKGDIALDEIKLTPGTCEGAATPRPPPPTTTKPTTPKLTTPKLTTPRLPGAKTVFCNFDSRSLCQFTQGTGDDFDWTLNRGTTGSAPDTGPSTDYSKTGYYIYSEASFPRQAGDRAHLYSPRLTGDHCLKFFFHMYGAQMGTLHVFVLDGATRNTVATYSGNRGNRWFSAKGTIRGAQPYQVVFEAVVGQGYTGDIALDDITLTPGSCDQPAVVTPPPTQPQQEYCSFDSRSLCGFIQDTGDNFDWKLQTGRTPNGPSTGPNSDFSGNGYYIYAEASSPRQPGDRARLKSPRVTGTNCLSFRFNMHGTDMGSLRVYGRVGSQEQQLWSHRGERGNTWDSVQLTIETSVQFQVVFEAVRGSGYLSDVALDEIRLVPGRCQSVAAQPLKPTTLSLRATPPAVGGGRCTADWSKHGGSCYKAFTNRLSWSLAKANCRKYDGFLVSINDVREYNFVKSLALRLSGDYAIWIGLRRGANGKFSHWNDNTTVTYTQWDGGEPDNFLGNEDCVEMFRWTGKWLDTTCAGAFAKKHPYICEIGERDTEPQCPRGWDRRENACYKVYSTLSKSWTEARSLCRESRADLVSITSSKHQAVVSGLVKLHSRDNYGFWIGLKRASSNTFSWADGSALSFTEWLRGEPNNWSRNEDCAYMSSITGYWLDSRCTRSLPFVCKISLFDDPPTPLPVTSPSPRATCGVKSAERSSGGNISRIVGGKIASAGAWPWQVAIMCKTCQSQDCGGTLVSPYHVVTAAHCVPSNMDTFIKNYKVRLGEQHFEKTEGNEQDINIAAAYRHQSYGVSTNYDLDIAVLKLASPAKFNSRVGPVCLQRSRADFPAGTPCFITGWGRTRQGGAVSSVLKEAMVPLVSREDCKRNYRAELITSNMLCAGFRGGGIDACQGDSGGPLVCEKDDRWYLVGTTSWGWGCAGQYFGVYTDIANLYYWIKANMV